MGHRVPENVLHQLALVGGSSDAILSHGLFRHKTVRPSFRRAAWLIVTFQLIALGSPRWYRHRPPGPF
jgi:uncharacterized membrane protein YsdA (DUF1294 family)